MMVTGITAKNPKQQAPRSRKDLGEPLIWAIALYSIRKFDLGVSVFPYKEIVYQTPLPRLHLQNSLAE